MTQSKMKTYLPANQYSIKTLLLEGFKGYREGFYLARLFVLRDYKAKYKTSYIGYLWEVMPSITTAFVWIFLRGSGAVTMAETHIPFPVFVLLGTLLWSIITDSIAKPMQVFMANSAIITKLNIPKEGLLLMGFLGILLNQSIKMILVIAILVYYGISPSWSILYFIPLILLTVVFFMSIGILLMPVEYMLPDLAKIKNYGLMALMYLSPVVYAVPSSGTVAQIIRLNPLSWIIDGLRNSLTGANVENPLFILWFLVLTSVVFILATLMYRITAPIIIQRISA